MMTIFRITSMASMISMAMVMAALIGYAAALEDKEAAQLPVVFAVIFAVMALILGSL